MSLRVSAKGRILRHEKFTEHSQSHLGINGGGPADLLFQPVSGGLPELRRERKLGLRLCATIHLHQNFSFQVMGASTARFEIVNGIDHAESSRVQMSRAIDLCQREVGTGQLRIELNG